ncbi:MAG: ABC transporter substrate-binding protein [Mycobacterium leprae]
MRKALATILALVLCVLSACTAKQPAPPAGGGGAAPAKVSLQFVFPVAVGGAAANSLNKMVSDFNAANPNIQVTPIFAGNYADTMTKVQTGIQGGTPPDVVVLLATDVYTLMDMNAIVPLDSYVQKDPDGQQYVSDFLTSLMLNSQINGKLWSIPFQRSVPVLYYNKALFKAAGLDPNAPPKTWADLVSYGHKLTVPGKQWGVEIPSDGYPYWVFSSFFIQNGKNIVNENGTQTYFNDPAVVDGLNFITSLAKSEKIMPSGVLNWADIPNDLVAGKVGMIYHTTGSIGLLKSKMDPANLGVALMPAGKKPGAPTGGGNIYMVKTTPEKQDATWKFIRFMTDTQRAAQWAVDTGYIATRQSAWNTDVMKNAVAAFPGYTVGRDELQYADRELATHQNQQVLKAFGDQLQAVVSGTKTAQAAMDQAQSDADKILTPFRK